MFKPSISQYSALSLALLLLGGATACTDPSSDSQDPDASPETPTEPTPEEPEEEALIDGVPASEHYAQFTWEESGSHVSGAAAIPTQPDGRNAILVQFFLMEEGDLHLFYAEGEGTVSSTGHSLSTYTDSQLRFDGSWSIDGSTLRLADYAHCDAFTFNGKAALQCQLDAALLTDAAVGATGIFRISLGESSPFDSDWNDYL